MEEFENGICKDTEKKHKIIPYDDENDAVIEPRCILCNSENRRQAEELWEQFHSYTKVHKFLLNNNDYLSINAVRNHLTNHYQRQNNIVLMRGYAEDLTKWIDAMSGESRQSAIKRRMAVLERELHVLASFSDALTPLERQKNAEQVRKITETLLNCEIKLEELDRSHEPAQILLDKLTSIFENKINSTDSKELKVSLIQVLDTLERDIGDITYEQKD